MTIVRFRAARPSEGFGTFLVGYINLFSGL